MALTFDQFMYGIGYQETRGNKNAYHEVNGYGAVGKYQVLKSNIPNWSQRILGYSISWQQFRDSPALQEKIVRGVLKGYFDAWGPRGAAAAWYGGPGSHNLDMSTRPQPGGPSIKTYVDSVLGWAGGSSGQNATYSATGTAPVKPKLDMDELAESYGLSSALINSSKELRDKFKQAVAETWSPAKFGAELKNTKWWKTQSSTLRKYITLKFTDPATFKQNWSNGQYKVNQLAVAVGLGNQITKGKSSKLLKEAIYNSLAMGWSDARIKDWMGAKATTHGGIMYGEAGEAFDKLHTLAYTNGMHYSGDWYKKQAVSIVSGKSTQETAEAQIRKAAAARYSAFSAQILAGQNAIDLAAPYIKSAATLLELPETDVDLFNAHIAKAMTAKPAKGAEGGSQMPLWQFENEVRNDPLWRKTNNARESMMTVARQVAKDFGMAY
jgi:hypothetical protein